MPFRTPFSARPPEGAQQPSTFRTIASKLLPGRQIRGALRRSEAFRWFLALPLLASTGLAACSWLSDDKPAPSWLGDGGDFGQRVRDGQVQGVAHHRFPSQALGREVGAVVATPPGYATTPERRYPVVYVFPGIGGDEWTSLLAMGLDGPSLKRLFADPLQAPIVVFGNPGNSGAHGPAARMLAEELVAFIDRTYRTRAENTARSLEGFSLGGVTALQLLATYPQTFGRAVAGSSACYLISACGALRESLRARAKSVGPERVMLTIGAKENADNRAVSEELAPLFGVNVLRVPNADHDWSLQLRTDVGGQPLGQRVAEFHLAGFTLGAPSAPGP